jgi:ABC-type transport system involved in multi-copper enzyme maturation permease subunit
MSAVLAIARREIEERSFVFVAAIAIALVPFVVLVVPHGSFGERKSGLVALGFFLAVAFTWALSLILGATLVGRELSEKRLSFYFTRPVSGSAIWFGKLLAAIALLVITFAIVNAIPLGLGGHEWQTMSTITRKWAAIDILAIGLILMLWAHVVSTWIRSKSPILALDFVALLLVIGILILALVPLLFAIAIGPATNVVALFLAALVIAAVGGGAWQLSRGRIDARRSHRELSAFVWSVLAIVSVSALVYSRWALAATPREVSSPSAMQRGMLVELRGRARGYVPEFVVNPANGEWVHGSGMTAASGDVVAVAAPAPRVTDILRGKLQGPMDWALTITRLDRQSRTLATLPFSGRIGVLGVSGDGSRLAVVADGILTIYDTPSRHALASWKIDDFGNMKLQFVSPFVVRAFLVRGHELRVRDFDARTRKSADVIAPLLISNDFSYRVAGSLLMTRNRSSVEVRDLNNPAAAPQVIPLGEGDGVWIMRDGRRAVYHPSSPAYVEIQRNGVMQRLIRFDPNAEGLRVAAEIGRGKLLVSTHTRELHGRYDSTTYIVDADGATSARIPHSMAISTWPWGLGAPEPGETHRAIVRRDEKRVDVIDLATGAIRPLL